MHYIIVPRINPNNYPMPDGTVARNEAEVERFLAKYPESDVYEAELKDGRFHKGEQIKWSSVSKKKPIPISITRARENMTETLDRVLNHGERFVVFRNAKKSKKQICLIVPLEEE